jgi:SAM-dependent methyltransferase
MAHRVCPWWLGYWLVCPARRLGQNPHNILAPLVHEGMIVLEPGPGMGFFTLELARLVGRSGRVVAVDVQAKMIDRLKRRAAKVDLLGRLDARIASPDSLGVGDLSGIVDFTLAFAVVHEFPDPRHLFTEVAAACRPGATILLAEPKGHVKPAKFDSELEAASSAGFQIVDHPVVRGSHTALLKKT